MESSIFIRFQLWLDFAYASEQLHLKFEVTWKQKKQILEGFHWAGSFPKIKSSAIISLVGFAPKQFKSSPERPEKYEELSKVGKSDLFSQSYSQYSTIENSFGSCILSYLHNLISQYMSA